MTPIISADQVASFRDLGYLVLHDVLSDDDLAPVRTEYASLLNEVADTLFEEGAISSSHGDCSFDERYIRMIGESQRTFQHLDITYPVVQEMPYDPPIHTGPAVFNLLTHPKILDIVEAVIGPEVFCNPTQHIRLKPPEKRLEEGGSKDYAGRTTWHQDLAGLLDEALDTDLLTVWIAISDATEEQGCLVVIPESHRSDGGEMTPHCPEGETASANYIPGRRLAAGKRVSLPVKRGGVVLLDKLTHHASLPNRSNDLRFAFDLRYQPVGQPTGRPAFPGFVARSIADPESVLTSVEEWSDLWRDSLRAIQSGDYVGPIYETARWESNRGVPPC